jgi:hypothetical protein
MRTHRTLSEPGGSVGERVAEAMKGDGREPGAVTNTL